MDSFARSGHSSGVPSISDLDGYTLRDYHFPSNGSYLQAEPDEFGFDPPEGKTFLSKFEQTCSPENSSSASPLGDWPGFERAEDQRHKMALEPGFPQDTVIAQNLSNKPSVLARYGQVTPPRTDSAGSMQTGDESQSPSVKGNDRPRRKTKSIKESNPPTTTQSGRKRKNSRKAAANADSNNSSEDTKRKASLEKNRVAAAKCRVNKKEKTEQLQRDSHDKAVHNAYLKGEVMRMREEVQQLNAVLLAHADCEGCRSPEEIQKHLQELSAEYLPHQIGLGSSGFPDYPDLQLDEMPPSRQGSMSSDGYFNMAPNDSSMLNPPLPEFNRSANFEVHTPMITD